MAKVIEPPILMSRILAFVLAASIVVLAALGFVLYKMIPLERPEVFFLINATRSVNVVIEPFDANNANNTSIENYKRGFIREYIIARNELNANPIITRNNWNNIVKPWSGNTVYKNFTSTSLYRKYMRNTQPQNVSCYVDFSDPEHSDAIIKTNRNDYTVYFRWICKNISGQPTTKNYKIQIKIQTDLDKRISGTMENLEKLKINPLGIQVTQYKIQDDKDPLSSDVIGK